MAIQPDNYKFINDFSGTNVSKEAIQQEKKISMVFLDAIKYIYERKLKDIPKEEAYEKWISDESILHYVFPISDELRIKRFLKNFYDNFEEYKDVGCIKAIQAFALKGTNPTKNYKECSEESRTFNVNDYLDLVCDKDGALLSIDDANTNSENNAGSFRDSLLAYIEIINQYGKIRTAKNNGNSIGRSR